MDDRRIPKPSWRVPRVTPQQIRIGKRLGLNLQGESQSVAAASIEDEVAPAIRGENAIKKATQKQIEYGAALCLDLTLVSRRVASALIHDVLLDRNLAAVEGLALRPGEKVRKITKMGASSLKRYERYFKGVESEWTQELVISSVNAQEGIVYFKGHQARFTAASNLTRNESGEIVWCQEI